MLTDAAIRGMADDDLVMTYCQLVREPDFPKIGSYERRACGNILNELTTRLGRAETTHRLQAQTAVLKLLDAGDRTNGNKSTARLDPVVASAA